MKLNALSSLAILILLAACGGSSGPDSPPAPAATPPASAPAAMPPAPVSSEDEVPEPSVLVQPGDDPVAEPSDPPEPEAAPDFALAGYEPPQSDSQQGVAARVQPVMDEAAGLAPLAAGAQYNIYVATGGSDDGPGTLKHPFRSLARAARAARPGARIFVAPGTYSGGFRTSAHGRADARISYISTRRWGARIVPPRNSPNKTAWDNRGNYVDIIGFEIDGSHYQGGRRWAIGLYNGGSHDSIRRNRVHHIAKATSCDSAGGAAIIVDSYYGGVRSDVISNLVHDIGPAGCRFVQGIYVSTSARVKNNVVYRVAEGGIHLWHDAHDVVITNNTVTDSNTGIIVGGGNFYRSSAGADHVAVYSNIVYANRMGISEQGKTGRNNSYRNNLVYANRSYNWRLKNGLGHSGTVSAAPMFLAGTHASLPNLRPAIGSPAINRATPAHAESTDFEGKPRNARAGYDIGAYQH